MSILPQLEHDLFQAAKQRLPAANLPDGIHDRRGRPEPQSTAPAGIRRRLASTTRALPMLLALGVTVIVAGFALILLDHRGESPPARPASSVQAARQELIGMLGILRRPQTHADLDRALLGLYLTNLDPDTGVIPPNRYIPMSRPGPSLKRSGYPELDRRLIRLERIPAWSAKVLIVPTTFQPSPSSPRRSEGVNLVLRIGSAPTIPPSSETGTGPRPTSIDTVRAHGLALADNVRGNYMLDGVVLVPDGVAKITLRVIRIIRTPVTIDPSQFGTATAPVHDNIAAFQLPIPTATSRHAFSSLFGTAAVAQATWYDTDGNVIKHTTTSLDVLIKVSGTKPRPSAAGTHHAKRRFCQQNPAC